MWQQTSIDARIALHQSRTIDVRATVYSPAAGVLVLPVVDGEVTADAGNRVRRTARLTVDPTYWPASPTDLLAPFGSKTLLEYGIVLRNGTEWIPLGLYSLDQTRRVRPMDSSGVSVDLVDQSARVAEDVFDVPSQTVAGATVVAEITRLIRRTLGSTQAVNDLTGSTQIAPVIEVNDPWADGVEKLATAIGAEVFFDQRGDAVIRPQPTLDDVPVWTISTGEQGVIVRATDTLTREGVYNRVTASGTRSDGTPPVFATVSDTNPRSPTRYGGPFGRRPRRYSSPLLTTVAQCTTAASTVLARSTGLGVRVGLEQITNPVLEPGDVIVLDQDGAKSTHIIDRITVPLSPDGVQQLSTRSLDLPPEQ